MELITEHREHVTIIRVIGQLWERNDIRALASEIEAVRAGGMKRIALDLERLTFVNSIGLGALVKTFAECAAAGDELILVRPTGSVLETMMISDFPRFIRIVESCEELSDLE